MAVAGSRVASESAQLVWLGAARERFHRVCIVKATVLAVGF